MQEKAYANSIQAGQPQAPSISGLMMDINSELVELSQLESQIADITQRITMQATPSAIDKGETPEHSSLEGRINSTLSRLRTIRQLFEKHVQTLNAAV